MSGGSPQLAYLGFEVKDLGAWERFGTEVLGLAVATRGADGAFSLRMDGHAHRFFVVPGPSDDLAVLGWEWPTEEAFEAAVARVRGAGIEVTPGTEEERAHRKVARLARYTDPGGLPSELCFGAERASEPFRSPLVRSGFVADDLGLGHLVVSAESQKQAHDFYVDVLGFRLSDHIRCEIHGFRVDIEFLHANARHHSVAFGDRQRKRLHHFMIEARSVDDVGLCLDRTVRSGLRLMQTLGRHPNDRMLSFYAKTPSGFQFEFGYGGREIDDSTWQPTEYDHISEWGHTPPEFLAPRKEAGPAR